MEELEFGNPIVIGGISLPSHHDVHDSPLQLFFGGDLVSVDDKTQAIMDAYAAVLHKVAQFRNNRKHKTCPLPPDLHQELERQKVMMLKTIGTIAFSTPRIHILRLNNISDN